MSLAASDRSKQPDNRTTMELGKVLPKTAEVRDGHLFIGGVDMVELAKQQGTALYVFDQADLEDRMRTFRSAFESRYPNSGIIFASKAFQNKEMVRLLAREGLFMDSSGGGELACALACGKNPKNVFLHGNNKTERELREAIPLRFRERRPAGRHRLGVGDVLVHERPVDGIIEHHRHEFVAVLPAGVVKVA